RTVLNDDKVLVNLSEHVKQVQDPSGKLLSYEIDLEAFLKARPEERADAALKLAVEALKAMKTADPNGQKARALASFLQDVDVYGPIGAPARLSVAEDGTFRLIFDLPGDDPSKKDAPRKQKIILGQFGQATQFRD